jgi:uncharacterized protein
MHNPFSLKVITEPAAFCDRIGEISALISYAQSNTNAVIFSPRRYGKTSLVKQVQNRLAAEGFVTIYIDLFGLSSTDNIAKRITRGVYGALYEQQALWKKALSLIKSHRPVIRPDESGGFAISAESASPTIFGADLLDQTLSELGEFIEAGKKKVNLVMDEFQEITEIRDANVEGIMRSHIQQHKASYFFVGSRRRVLLEMFNQKRRPFFQSALNFKLEKLPAEELSAFLVQRCETGQKGCGLQQAKRMVELVGAHPYYTQKLAFYCYERAGQAMSDHDINQGFADLVQGEAPVFEAIIQGLATRQIALLRAIAKEPSTSIMSMEFIKRHGLRSIGGIQAAVKKLAVLDLIEKDENGRWRVVDQIFAHWLAK